MNGNLKRRLSRLQAEFQTLWPAQPETACDRRAQRLRDELLRRIDPMYATAIRKELSAVKRALESGRNPELSRLLVGFSATVFGHMERDAPLEFPADVARAYQQSRGWEYGECQSCRYRFPPYRQDIALERCPVCNGSRAPYLGGNRGGRAPAHNDSLER